MGNRKPNAKELAISRVTVMLFSLVLLSLLTYLYIIPFKKHYLQINNYYVYIEYAAMAVTFLAFAAAVVFSRLKRSLDYSQRLITPNYFLILSCAAFAAAVIIPLSSNRTLSSKYAVICYVCILIAYIAYYFINHGFAYQAVVCGIYCVLFSLTDVFFSNRVTFNESLSIGYPAYLTLFGALLIFIIIVTFFVSGKYQSVKLWHTAAFSAVSAAALITRVFVISYVSTVAVLTIIVMFVILAVYEKIGEKKGV